MSMRPILFRGRKSDGTWLQGDLNHIGGKVYIFPRSEDFPLNSPDYFEVQPETVGQFTGANDTKGRKIFEGDDMLLTYKGDRGSIHLKVKYMPTHTHFSAVRHDGYCYSLGYSGSAVESFVVTAPVYDNPELLQP